MVKRSGKRAGKPAYPGNKPSKTGNPSGIKRSNNAPKSKGRAASSGKKK